MDVDIPLNCVVGICGVSGSGKSSLSLGVLYAEGSRRYLEALSTYTRRRISQSGKANIDSIEHIPATLALNQRPAIPGIRSTFGTQTELLNSIRLLFSRCGSYKCPKCGNYLEPSINVASDIELECDNCHHKFMGLGAEDYSFNSTGACSNCSGTGIEHVIDEESLVDPNKSLKDGAVTSWQKTNLWWMYLVAQEAGVNAEIPFKDLSQYEKDIVLYGDEFNKYITIVSKSGKIFDLDATFLNAYTVVENALNKSTSEKELKKINRFLKTSTCSTCNGSRINEQANSTLLNGKTLSEVSNMTMDKLVLWLEDVVSSLNDKALKTMAANIIEEFMINANYLKKLGLDYITLNRPSSTLSTGELQRVQLARTLRNRTTGLLYVLDEPSIGLHLSNMEGLISVIKQLVRDGNSVVIVDHEMLLLDSCDYIIEIGPKAGNNGGTIVSQGLIKDVKNDENSIIAGYLNGVENTVIRDISTKDDLFDEGSIELETSPIYTLKDLSLKLPKEKLSVITGVSGSGKTTLILESLYPAINNTINNQKLPKHIKSIDSDIEKVYLIDSSPIGKNVKSTVGTYSKVLDKIRKLYADISDFYKTADFSYNTGKLQCPHCKGTGIISMDVQFLPDIEITCPECQGLRYSDEVDNVLYNTYSIKDIMGLTIEEAVDVFKDETTIRNKLSLLNDLGLGYLTIGESTPKLSGGEAQRLKLASQINKSQKNSLFIFDEPSIGLHPRDVIVLNKTFQKLLDKKATIVVIEHDVDIIHNADYIVDMGPGGGVNGGEILVMGTLEDLKECEKSITKKYV